MPGPRQRDLGGDQRDMRCWICGADKIAIQYVNTQPLNSVGHPVRGAVDRHAVCLACPRCDSGSAAHARNR